VARLAAVDFTRLRPPHRRIEPLGTWRGTEFYDDFGHNPHQIRAAFQTLREHRPEAAISAYLRPSGFQRLHAFGTAAYADALQTFSTVRVAPARPTFEDTAGGSDFADRLCAELRARGVDARVRPSCTPVVEELAGSGVACLFSILPPATGLLRAGQFEGSRL
jgi:UDP-N-acetylmuramate-alanine ligase